MIYKGGVMVKFIPPNFDITSACSVIFGMAWLEPNSPRTIVSLCAFCDYAPRSGIFDR